MMTTSHGNQPQYPQPPTLETPNIAISEAPFLPYVINQRPFLYPPPSFVSH